jgi:hypothetical protein
MALALFDLWKTLKGLWLTGNGQMLLRESEAIKIDGVLLGVAVSHRLGVQFIASNDCVTDTPHDGTRFASGHARPRGGCSFHRPLFHGSSHPCPPPVADSFASSVPSVGVAGHAECVSR